MIDEELYVPTDVDEYAQLNSKVTDSLFTSTTDSFSLFSDSLSYMEKIVVKMLARHKPQYTTLPGAKRAECPKELAPNGWKYLWNRVMKWRETNNLGCDVNSLKFLDLGSGAH